MKKILVLMLTMLMAIGFSSAASAAMSIEFDFYGGTTSYAQGVYDTGGVIDLLPKTDWVLVDIVAAGVPLGNGVAVFSWVASFNSAAMEASDLQSDFPGFATASEIDNAAGTVKLEKLFAPPNPGDKPPDGDVILGTFRLDCTKASIGDLLTIAALNNVNNLLADGTNFSNMYDDVDVTVNQVPIPAAAWLLGSGLLGLVAIRRKK
jgi:hypothetical protein